MMYSNKVSREAGVLPLHYEEVSVFLRSYAALVQKFKLLHVSVFVLHLLDAVNIGIGVG